VRKLMLSELADIEIPSDLLRSTKADRHLKELCAYIKDGDLGDRENEEVLEMADALKNKWNEKANEPVGTKRRLRSHGMVEEDKENFQGGKENGDKMQADEDAKINGDGEGNSKKRRTLSEEEVVGPVMTPPPETVDPETVARQKMVKALEMAVKKSNGEVRGICEELENAIYEQHKCTGHPLYQKQLEAIIENFQNDAQLEKFVGGEMSPQQLAKETMEAYNNDEKCPCDLCKSDIEPVEEAEKSAIDGEIVGSQ